MLSEFWKVKKIFLVDPLLKFKFFSVQNSRDNMSVILVSLENAPKAEEAEIAQFKKVDEQIVQDMKGKKDERVWIGGWSIQSKRF